MEKFAFAVTMAAMAVLNVQSATHEKVQLWEGGPYWASTNIGADKPEDSGLYFQWGDTTGHRPSADGTFSFSFNSSNCPTYNKNSATLQSKGWIVSQNGTYVLAPSHDAAHVHWGGSWRMPTYQELNDLCNNKCDRTWTTQNGVNGFIVRGRGAYASNSIFLPASGLGSGLGSGTSLYYSGSRGYFWSSVSYSDYYNSRCLYFDSGYHHAGSCRRDYGFPVRPVQDSNGGAVADCVIHFDANGGTGNMDDQTLEDGETQKLSKNNYCKDGYVFQGWAETKADADNGFVKYSDETLISVESDMTLYAVWALTAQIDTHEKVQLWEGGPYWATTNIGADKPEEYGLYFWWGDTEGHRPSADGTFSFSFEASNCPTFDKNIATLQSEGWIVSKDGKHVLAPSHDAAHVKWGGSWRMPTDQELSDLCSKCDWTWTNVNGVTGYIVRGRGAYASNSIFLPCAGCCYVYRVSLDGIGSCGFYWSSVPDLDISNAFKLGIDSRYHSTDYYVRICGQSIRPVQGFGEENIVEEAIVSFNANGGTGTMENQTFEDGKAQKLEKNTYRKDGYVFQGWAVSANGEVVYEDEAEITVDSDMTLYAVWKGLLPLTLTVDSADFSAGSIKLRWNAEDYPEGTTFKVLRTSGGETMNEVATGISESTWTDKNFLTAGTSPFDQVSYCVEPELGDISQSLRSLPVHTRNRRALCVGIDKYKEPGDDLKYCVSDAAEWRSMLRNYGGFTTGVPLDDDSAKKERILSELSKCAEAAMPGDIFVYTHSSHGNEEILWCYDFNLTAAEFAKALMKFPKGTGLIVILDACHSGSMPNTSPVRMMSAMPLRSATASMARSSFVESVMAEMELARSPRTSSLRTTQEGVVRETISSGSEIGWLTAVDSVQLSTDGAYSSKCLQTAGWRYGGADRGDNGGNNDGRVSFWELGVFADYWFERMFDRYEMSPQKFSADILKAVVAGSVPSVGTYGKLSAPTGVSATMDRPRRISVSWNAVPGTTKYEVRCSGDTTDIFHSTGDATAILTMLQPGDYSIYVKATNPMDVSLPSSTVPGHAAESSTSIPVVAADATTEAVTAAIDGVGFVDESAVKDAINGSAVEYAAFKEWAGSVKGAGSASSAAAGEASVIANTNAAAAYLLGAERLFENAPKIEFEEASVSDGEDGGESGALGITRPAITLSVVVKDGEAAVKCAAEKVKSLFKATSDLSDWNGAAKLEPEVSIEVTDDPTTMRFKVTPGDGTLPQAFLRIRK